MGIHHPSRPRQILANHSIYPQYSCVSATTIGSQYHQQDFLFSLRLSPTLSLFCMLDGEHGPQLAHFCHDFLKEYKCKCKCECMGECKSIGEYDFDQRKMLEEIIIHMGEALTPDILPKIREGYGLPVTTSRAQCSIMLITVGNEILVGNLGECRCYVTYSFSPEKAVRIGDGGTGWNGRTGWNGITNNNKQIHNNNGQIHNNNGQIQNNEHIHNSNTQLHITALNRSDVKKLVIGSSGVWQHWETVLHTIHNISAYTIEQEKIKVKQMFSTIIEQQKQSNNMSLFLIEMKE